MTRYNFAPAMFEQTNVPDESADLTKPNFSKNSSLSAVSGFVVKVEIPASSACCRTASMRLFPTWLRLADGRTTTSLTLPDCSSSDAQPTTCRPCLTTTVRSLPLPSRGILFPRQVKTFQCLCLLLDVRLNLVGIGNTHFRVQRTIRRHQIRPTIFESPSCYVCGIRSTQMRHLILRHDQESTIPCASTHEQVDPNIQRTPRRQAHRSTPIQLCPYYCGRMLTGGAPSPSRQNGRTLPRSA